jgi:hypothetical protein
LDGRGKGCGFRPSDSQTTCPNHQFGVFGRETVKRYRMGREGIEKTASNSFRGRQLILIFEFLMAIRVYP